MLYKIKAHRQSVFLCVLGVAYFVLLLRYYLSPYHVPDFGYYFSMAAQGFPAKDGFSSLFLQFAALGAHMPLQLNVFCLLLMTCSLVNISFFVKALFSRANLFYYLSLVTLYSCGAFYYIYGKLVYDFPFTAFTYSLCLLLTRTLFIRLEEGRESHKIWLMLCGLLGLCLSWKPYNIFCVAGLGLLLFIRQVSRTYLCEVLHSIRKLLISILCFVLGYIAGNYNLLLRPLETLQGIRAYPAGSSFGAFLYSKAGIIWDHVNNLPFHLSVMSLFSAGILLYVLPILLKKFQYLALSAFMTGCFFLYIRNFSPGYAWHGFPMGLFIVTYTAFLLSDIHCPLPWRGGRTALLTAAVAVQAVTCFAYYLPLQHYWHDRTMAAIHVLENREHELYEVVNGLLDQIQDSSFTIDVAIKRYRPVAVGPDTWEPASLENTYHAPRNYVFADPLTAVNYLDWTYLRQNGRYNYGTDAEYVIWIVPDPLKQIGSVADLHCYEGFYLTDMVHGEGYTVYLYHAPQD